MKLMTILGTRPEIIRLSLVIPKLDKRCEHILVHTGQNYHERLNDIFFKELGLRAPDRCFQRLRDLRLALRRSDLPAQGLGDVEAVHRRPFLGQHPAERPRAERPCPGPATARVRGQEGSATDGCGMPGGGRAAAAQLSLAVTFHF